ncbi:MAG: tetratricopeptide repeat protein [Planctomycetes bacterium]|nr:tetratricopeptide repeat protein [Planctomycetota bacterium]
MNPHFERAQLLFQQSRFDHAEESLRRSLAADPDHAWSHALLALCLLHSKEYQEATAEAERAIGASPDLPVAHYALASVFLARNRPEDAEKVAKQAVELNPYDADLHQLLGATYMELRRWPSALEEAEEGLRLDAEHSGCANLKAMALVKLGRKEEASLMMEGVLARDPEDAYSHANQGWTALHESDPQKALIHFREALRLDPTLEFAQAGMVEALKARYWIYRQMLRWFLWMESIGQKWQWGIILLIFFGTKFVRQAADNNPNLGMVLWPIYGVLVGFAVMTWLANPLFNLMLRLNRFGKHILTSDQKWGANAVGLCLLLALGMLAYGLIEDDLIAVYMAIACGVYLLVLAALFQVPKGLPRYGMAVAAVVLAGIAIYAFHLIYSSLDLPRDALRAQAKEGFTLLYSFYFPGVLIYSIVANVLGQVRFENR